MNPIVEFVMAVEEYFERPCPKYPQGRKRTYANDRQILAEEPYPLIDHKGQVCDEPILCSGKVYYDLSEQRNKEQNPVAIVRVEQFYPFPTDAIQQALEAVPADQRTCLVLNMYQGLSYKEIAETIGISVNLVAVRIFRGREKFVEAYKKANPAE